jgi:hypothetical protein
MRISYNNISHTSLIFVFVSICLSGCHTLDLLYLKQPTMTNPEATEQVLQPQATDDDLSGAIKNMLGRIEIQGSQSVSQVEMSEILIDCLTFLLETFGPPIYEGRVVIIITEAPYDNAFLVWDDVNTLERNITLNHYNVLKPVWYHYIVHELFHAFYQSNNFLVAYPDAIIEGLAFYAQYKYRYKDADNNEIIDKILNEIDIARKYRPNNEFDFDLPFQSYGKAERKYAYLISGLLFFKQDLESVHSIIQKILRIPLTKTDKVIFRDIVAEYGLKMEDTALQNTAKQTLDLSEPKKLDIQTDQSLEDNYKPKKPQKRP